jgi:hypothetical protein
MVLVESLSFVKEHSKMHLRSILAANVIRAFLINDVPPFLSRIVFISSNALALVDCSGANFYAHDLLRNVDFKKVWLDFWFRHHQRILRSLAPKEPTRRKT